MSIVEVKTSEKGMEKSQQNKTSAAAESPMIKSASFSSRKKR